MFKVGWIRRRRRGRPPPHPLRNETDLRCGDTLATTTTGSLFTSCCFSKFEDFYKELNRQVPNVSMWSARVLHDQITPCVTGRFRFTKPLRCPAVVVSEIQRTLKKWTGLFPIDVYSEDLVQPCEGPTARTLRHQGGQHTRTQPLDCQTCGRDLASVLKELHVNGITCLSLLSVRLSIYYPQLFPLSRNLLTNVLDQLC